jgi:hypothetical protein
MERFTFDFNLVWNNLRLRIRSLGLDSLWYKSLHAIVHLILFDRSVRASWLYRQMWLETSDGYGLTLWGQRYKIPRYTGEGDDEYRARILIERALYKGGGTDANRKRIISYILQTENIVIERMYDWQATIGGAVGEPIGSLEYGRFCYKIYVYDVLPELLNDTNLNRLTRLLTAVNVFGNTWELYIESENGNYLEVPIQLSSSSVKQLFSLI